MPGFSIQEYRSLLAAMVETGYEFRPVCRMPEPTNGPTAYLRHDVDFHLIRQDEVARVDADLGVQSTFFVQVSAHYNPLEPENRRVIESFVEMGHEVGLHYDLRSYPSESAEIDRRLRREIDLLEWISDQRVQSICMHEPSAGHGDLLLDVDGFVHPHAERFAEGLTYVSDSCRAWRDDTLKEAIDDPAGRRLLLNLHGELWLDGAVESRLDYLEHVSLPLACRSATHYFRDYLPGIWRTHPAVKLDEARVLEANDG